MKKVLEVNNLTKTFKGKNKQEFTAVSNIDFCLYEGECLGIIGESGSGKSTTVNMITRLIEPTDGTITIDGEDITHIKGKALRSLYKKLQMVFQSPIESFDPRCTLGDGIAESLKNNGFSKKEAAAAVEKVLEKCGLDGSFAGRFPHEVSGGQCQRAAIARALAIDPTILICDEATSALDVTIQKEIIDLLRSLRESQGKKLSILFICHDLAVVQDFCDRVLVMHDGEIVEQGKPDDIIKNPQNDYTKRLIESVL
ncbi:peptide/nickel transport system ATP-binding protein [Pseudobutyrivibrio sp. OR37]|uniref:ABC transporter ATP-binding protein n=1 Tax=Pseudobutyrivibrio sp. OR37 TaxID=1798186 RepID=UPI0008E6A477|nr:ATP-binding cassette domain-containing protein [Pseudobutyrivibrio sp. OR37]SFH66793.1 peptide/nickel transport system ATP-binding protein [Pseudobutyrivibrio sp. OR37]